MKKHIAKHLHQTDAPLWDAVIGYADRPIIPFHTPGHKRRGELFPEIVEYFGRRLFAADSSDEVAAPDFNDSFHACLRAAEDLAADLFGAQRSIFLVNGTSSGIHAMLGSLQGKIILPRFSHLAAYAGCAVADVSVSYLPTQMDKEWQIPRPHSPGEIRATIRQEKPNALLLTYPSYYGTAEDLESVCRMARGEGTVVLVDEAHGAHFLFSEQLPKPALALGVAASAQSTHKTLGTMTQTSLLHINDDLLLDPIEGFLNLISTSSPSLIFLAIMDAVRRTLYVRGRVLVEKAFELASQTRRALANIPGVEVFPLDRQVDPTKIVFSLRQIGLRGTEVEEMLRQDYQIQVELSDPLNVLVLISIGDTPESCQSLVAAVKDIAERFGHRSPLVVPVDISYPQLPQCAIGLRTALRQPSDWLPWRKSLGRIAGDFIVPYPPGVPLIVPGELISADVLGYLELAAASGWFVRGLAQEKIRVIKE